MAKRPSAWPRPRPHPLALQQMYMQRVWPQIECAVRSSFLTCGGTVRPSPLCHEYQVRLEYQLGSYPKAWVDSPALIRRIPEEPIPHVYTTGGLRPCLFFRDEWQPDKWLALTIMPWLLLWLFFYEIWLATGEWLGGGVDHGGRK